MGEIVASQPPFKWTAGWRTLLVLGSFFSSGPLIYFYGTLAWYVSHAPDAPFPTEAVVSVVVAIFLLTLILPAALPRIAILPVWLFNLGIFLYLAAEAVPVWQHLNDPTSPDFKPDFSGGELIPPPLLQMALSAAIFAVVLWRPMKQTLGSWLPRIRRILRTGWSRSKQFRTFSGSFLPYWLIYSVSWAKFVIFCHDRIQTSPAQFFDPSCNSRSAHLTSGCYKGDTSRANRTLSVSCRTVPKTCYASNVCALLPRPRRGTRSSELWLGTQVRDAPRRPSSRLRVRAAADTGGNSPCPDKMQCQPAARWNKRIFV